MYRILRKEGQLKHRERSKPPTRHRPTPHVATGPQQVASWDITYLKSPVRGCFFYLYMVEDVWSRKILGWAVHEVECNELAAELIEKVCKEHGIDADSLVLHSDNGSPMKGATMLATMQRLGVMPSFSRPSVSNDNPFSEALFRTLKYRPEFPSRPFTSIEDARAWVENFVAWYNTTHLHSGIRFVTPDDRHYGRETEILAGRRCVYELARRSHPDRWSGECRNWTPVGDVYLNPHKLEVAPPTPAQEEIAMAA